MVAKQLVERIPDPVDRRTVRIRLTEHGRRTIDDLFALHIANAASCETLSGASADPQTRIAAEYLALKQLAMFHRHRKLAMLVAGVMVLGAVANALQRDYGIAAMNVLLAAVLGYQLYYAKRLRRRVALLSA